MSATNGRPISDRRDWLASIQPYPRFSVSTSVLENASTRVERVLHQPVLTDQHTFTFVRKLDAAQLYDADIPAEVIASAVETMRRQARLDTDRFRDLWETASTTYAAAQPKRTTSSSDSTHSTPQPQHSPNTSTPRYASLL